MYTLWVVSSSYVRANNEDLQDTLNATSWLSVGTGMKNRFDNGSLKFAYSGFNKLVLIFNTQDDHKLSPYKFMLNQEIKEAFSVGDRYIEPKHVLKTSEKYSLLEKKLDFLEDVLYFIKDSSTFCIELGKQLDLDLEIPNSMSGASINLKNTSRVRYNKDSFTSCLNELLISFGVVKQERDKYV